MAQGCDIKKSMDGYSSCLDLVIVVLEFKKDLRLLEKVEEYCNLDLVQAEIKFFIIVRHLAQREVQPAIRLPQGFWRSFSKTKEGIHITGFVQTNDLILDW